MALVTLMYLKINGSDVPGNAPTDSKAIECYSFRHSARTHFDADHGALTRGGVVWEPYMVETAWGAHVPLVQQALTDRTAVEVSFKQSRPHPGGDATDQHYMTYTAKNARVVAIEHESPNTLSEHGRNMPDLFRIQIVAETMSVTHEDGGQAAEYSRTQRQ